MTKKILIIVVVAFFSIMVLSVFFYQRSKTQTVNIVFNEPATVSIYKPSGDDGVVENEIKKINKPGKVRLNKGYYKYKAEPTDKLFANVEGDLLLENKPVVLDIVFDNLSSSELQKKLALELPFIEQAIKSKYPAQMEKYTIKEPKIHKKGDWFSAKLNTTDSNNSDDLLIVLEKSNNTWVIATTPDISLSKDVYPNIPSDILEEINLVK
jgi:hypothetical protein